jgi:hypothetical protein
MYTIDPSAGDVLTVRHDDVAAGWEQRYLLMGDVHWDNPHCDRQLLKRLMDQAVALGAGICSFGDWFDAMGGKHDPRRSKSGIRTEHNADNYLDRLVEDAAAWLAPYRANLVMLSDGNHETAIKRATETDILARLCAALDVAHMGYTGYLRCMFTRSTGARTQRRLYWDHGWGGGGPVTRGVINTNRRAVVIPDADIVVSAHIHEAWIMEVPRVRLSDMGRVYYDRQTHVQLATFKQEHVLRGGYHIEKGRPPKPLGGWWLVFRYRRDAPGTVEYTVERAL